MRIPALNEMNALLVGATSGVGLEIAAQLAQAGVQKLVMCGRDAVRGRHAMESVLARAPNTKVNFVCADASTPEGVAVIAQASHLQGGSDILVNAVPGNIPPAPFSRLDIEALPSLIGLHLHSVFRCTHAILPEMVERGAGVIINIASDAAKIPTPGETVHGALMAAIVMFSRTLALEEARHGVRIHALTPSIIADTLSHSRMMSDPFSEKLFLKAQSRAALGVPVPADVAAIAVFLCTPAAARMTGQAITINGGLAVA